MLMGSRVRVGFRSPKLHMQPIIFVLQVVSGIRPSGTALHDWFNGLKHTNTKRPSSLLPARADERANGAAAEWSPMRLAGPGVGRIVHLDPCAHQHIQIFSSRPTAHCAARPLARPPGRPLMRPLVRLSCPDCDHLSGA